MSNRYVLSSCAARVALAVSLGLAGGLIALSAGAAPLPNYAARLMAEFHIKLAVSDVVLPDSFPGECWVSGTVVRLFRDRENILSEGDVIEVVAQCALASAESGTGDNADAEELSSARFVEMFLNSHPDTTYDLVRNQYMVIKNATQDPLCETERAGIMC